MLPTSSLRRHGLSQLLVHCAVNIVALRVVLAHGCAQGSKVANGVFVGVGGFGAGCLLVLPRHRRFFTLICVVCRVLRQPRAVAIGDRLNVCRRDARRLWAIGGRHDLGSTAADFDAMVIHDLQFLLARVNLVKETCHHPVCLAKLCLVLLDNVLVACIQGACFVGERGHVPPVPILQAWDHLLFNQVHHVADQCSLRIVHRPCTALSELQQLLLHPVKDGCPPLLVWCHCH
mmetsp:Transcript_70460/g.177644  ORF Transcript_70460/g.177644 Transcript_70460/m.177644 type:complete len:232 (-) Transcript_70460:214-909(-)